MREIQLACGDVRREVNRPPQMPSQAGLARRGNRIASIRFGERSPQEKKVHRPEQRLLVVFC
jgi:hypothetical protein